MLAIDRLLRLLSCWATMCFSTFREDRFENLHFEMTFVFVVIFNSKIIRGVANDRANEGMTHRNENQPGVPPGQKMTHYNLIRMKNIQNFCSN